MSKAPTCHTIRILLMKATRMNMVDMLTVNDKDSLAEVVDLAAGHPWALGEGVYLSVLCVSFVLIEHKYSYFTS